MEKKERKKERRRSEKQVLHNLKITCKKILIKVLTLKIAMFYLHFTPKLTLNLRPGGPPEPHLGGPGDIVAL